MASIKSSSTCASYVYMHEVGADEIRLASVRQVCFLYRVSESKAGMTLMGAKGIKSPT